MTPPKKWLKFLFVAALAVLSPLVRADYANVRLVLDARNVPELPRHFRTTADVPRNMNAQQLLGFADLHIAGGAQFSELGLRQIIKRLPTKHITVIDLRQESHGFLNGNAVSWYGPEDAANAHKTRAQINEDQSKRLEALSKKKIATVDRVLKKSELLGEIASVKPVEFVVHWVMSEEDLVHKHHLRYQRIYVQDFHAPTNPEVDRFIRIIKQLPPQQWIYFHCHGGVGRTTSAMVMYDMMHNAKRVSLEDILARQRAIGGKDLQKLPSERSFKFAAAGERIGFLRKFYDYARENNDNFETSWSAWVKEKN